MEGPQSSVSLQDPSPSPLEVPEESMPREPPRGNPRTESSDMKIILEHLRKLEARQDSLLSEMAEIRTSISQMNQWVKEAESRFSSLEARAQESQQTDSTMLASRFDTTGVPSASSPSFSSPQMIMDAAQTAASPGCASVYPGDASTEPAPLPSSELFRTTSSNLMYSEMKEKAYQMLPGVWPQEITLESEAARIEAEETGNQEDTSSGPSSLMAPECKMQPEILTSTGERALPIITAVCSLKRISESETALIGAEETDHQEDTFSRASPLMAPERKRGPETLTSTEEAALPMTPAECCLERIFEGEAGLTGAEETNQQEDTFSRALPSHSPEHETDPHPLTSTEEAALPMTRSECSLQISEGETANTLAEETDQQEDTFSRALPFLAPGYETDPQPLMSTEEPALPIIAAVGLQETIAESETAHTEPEESDHDEGNLAGGSPQAYKPQQQPLTSTLPETPRLTAVAAMQTEATGSATWLSRRRFTNSSTALTGTTISAGTLGHLASSSPTEVRPPARRQRTSYVWHFFTERSTFIATCNMCQKDLKTGKEGGSYWGSTALKSHLNRMHGISKENWAEFV